MKITNNILRPLPVTILVFSVGMFFSGCDSLEEEIAPTSAEQVIKVEYGDLYVINQGVGVVDVTKGVTSNKPILVTIAKHPDKGDLQSLEKGVYSYTPDETFVKGTDKFIVNIKSVEGNLSVNDTIHVVVAEEESELPCDYYAVNEEVNIGHAGDTLIIDVLANDISCGAHTADPSTLKVLYATPNGTASIENGKVRFLHDPAMPFSGNILYSVNLADCSECTRAAYVKLSGPAPTPCTNTMLAPDSLTISTTGPVTFNNEFTFTRVRVLNNDRFCGGDSLAQKVLSIVEGPVFGQAQVDEGSDFIKYWLPLNTIVDLRDSITYQVCVDGTCLRESVYLKVRFNPSCAIYPVADSIHVTPSADTSWLLDVLANDEVCELAENTTIHITQAPASGTVAVENGKVRYTNTATRFDEQFRYTICTTNGFCSNTKATVKIAR